MTENKEAAELQPMADPAEDAVINTPGMVMSRGLLYMVHGNLLLLMNLPVHVASAAKQTDCCILSMTNNR